MAAFQWTPTYSVKVDLFDKQHQALFGYMNDLNDAMAARRGQEVLTGILDQLFKYTEEHFTVEEKKMAQAGYPDLSLHQAQHRVFTGKIKEFQQASREGRLGLSVNVSGFLQDWFKKHILAIDQKYSEYLNQRGVR